MERIRERKRICFKGGHSAAYAFGGLGKGVFAGGLVSKFFNDVLRLN